MATMRAQGIDRHGQPIWLFRHHGAKARSFHGSEREAQVEFARYVVAVHARQVPRSGGPPIGDLLEEWFRTKPWASAGSRKATREALDRYLLPHFGTVRTHRFDEGRIEKFYAGLLDGSLTKRGRPLAPRTLRRLHADLHVFCVWAVRKKWLAYNPAALVEVPAIPRTTVRAPEHDDVTAVIAEAGMRQTRGRVMVPCPEFGTYVHLIAATGRRREDGLAVQVRDVHPGEGVVVFDKRAVDAGYGQGVIIEAGDKNALAARIPVDDDVMADLVAQIERMKARAAHFGVTLPRTAFLFSDHIDGHLPWSPNAATANFRTVTRRLGLEGVTLHSLRHAVITTLLEEGMDLESVAHHVGDTTQTILRVYSHYRRVNDRRAAEIMRRVRRGEPAGLHLLTGGSGA